LAYRAIAVCLHLLSFDDMGRLHSAIPQVRHTLETEETQQLTARWRRAARRKRSSAQPRQEAAFASIPSKERCPFAEAQEGGNLWRFCWLQSSGRDQVRLNWAEHSLVSGEADHLFWTLDGSGLREISDSVAEASSMQLMIELSLSCGPYPPSACIDQQVGDIRAVRDNRNDRFPHPSNQLRLDVFGVEDASDISILASAHERLEQQGQQQAGGVIVSTSLRTTGGGLDTESAERPVDGHIEARSGPCVLHELLEVTDGVESFVNHNPIGEPSEQPRGGEARFECRMNCREQVHGRTPSTWAERKRRDFGAISESASIPPRQSAARPQ
jgi:hypothetical protein